MVKKRRSVRLAPLKHTKIAGLKMCPWFFYLLIEICVLVWLLWGRYWILMCKVFTSFLVPVLHVFFSGFTSLVDLSEGSNYGYGLRTSAVHVLDTFHQVCANCASISQHQNQISNRTNARPHWLNLHTSVRRFDK